MEAADLANGPNGGPGSLDAIPASEVGVNPEDRGAEAEFVQGRVDEDGATG